MATSDGAFSQVSSLYGPGTVAAWLSCCVSVAITLHFNPKYRNDLRLTYDLIMAILYPLWAASDVAYQHYKLGGYERLREEWHDAEQFTNKIQAPMTICIAFFWLPLPILLHHIRLHKVFPSDTKMIVWHVALSFIAIAIFTAGIWMPISFRYVPCQGEDGTCIRKFSHFRELDWLAIWLGCLPFLLDWLVVLGMKRRLRFWNEMAGRPIALLTTLMCCFVLLSVPFDGDKYRCISRCPDVHMRPIWWIFSIIPQSGISLQGDQLYALACGILTILWSVWDIVAA